MADVPPIRSGSATPADARAASQARPAPPLGATFAAHLKATARPPLPFASGSSPQRHGARLSSADADLAAANNSAGKTASRPAEDVTVGDERPSHRCSPPTDLLDPMARSLLSQGFAAEKATAATNLPPSDPAALASRVSLEHVMSRFVRRVAWSGDAHTGTARLEFGAGALEGGTLVIRSDNGAVSVSLELPPGVDSTEWRDRIARRLAARGLQVAAVDVE